MHFFRYSAYSVTKLCSLWKKEYTLCLSDFVAILLNTSCLSDFLAKQCFFSPPLRKPFFYLILGGKSKLFVTCTTPFVVNRLIRPV